MRRICLLLVILLACTAAAVHDNSWSSTRVTMNGDDAEIALTVQTLSVIEVIEADRDGDAWLSAEELDAVDAELAAYLDEHHVVTAVDAADARTPLVLGEPTFERREDLDSLPPLQWIDVTWRAAASREPLTALELESTLFLTTSPGHRSYADVAWDAELSDARVLWMGEIRTAFERPAPPVELTRHEPPPVELSSVEPAGVTLERPPARTLRLDVLVLIALAVHAAGYGLRGAGVGLLVACVCLAAQQLVAQGIYGLSTLPSPGAPILALVGLTVLAWRCRMSEPSEMLRLLPECLVWAAFIAGFAHPEDALPWPSLLGLALIWCGGPLALGFLGWVVSRISQRRSSPIG